MRRADSRLMDYDYVLLGLTGDDLYLAGPFENALAAIQLLARDVAGSLGESASALVQYESSTQRAVVMLATQMPDGSFLTSAQMMVPVPKVDGREDIYAITDIGLWENELAQPSD